VSTLANAAGKFADKIVELLDVFDLSFFVSGAVAVGAGAMVFGVSPMDLGSIGVTTGLLLVVIAYFAGLLCFAVGRWVRSRVLGLSLGEFRERAAALATVDEVADLFRHGELRAGEDRQLYDRLWVLVRTLPELAASFALLKRYWILSATFDGLMVAVLLWNVPIFLVLEAGTGEQAALSVVTLALAGFSLRQASEYRSYQGAEIVATVRQWSALYAVDRQLVRDRARAEIAAMTQVKPPPAA
jgi:hypothetical protein